MPGKYSSVTNDVFLLFQTDEWLAEGIETRPNNFVGGVTNTEYIRATVLASGDQPANPLHSVSGQLLIEIYTSAGEGVDRSNLIADILDSHLAGKIYKSGESGQTQFGPSGLSGGDFDKVNSSLYRVLYTIPFNYFGV